MRFRTLVPYLMGSVILALALAAGWGIGQLPTPAPPAIAPRPAPVAAGGSVPAGPIAVETRVVPAPDAVGTALPPVPEPVRPEPVEPSQWTTLESALEESRRNGKPILVDFNADWCPPCQRMKRDVFDAPRHGDAVRAAVIPVSIVDRVRETGTNPPSVEDLQRRYQVDAFPTLVVFSPATGREVKSRGYGGAEATVQWIREAARSVR